MRNEQCPVGATAGLPGSESRVAAMIFRHRLCHFWRLIRKIVRATLSVHAGRVPLTEDE